MEIAARMTGSRRAGDAILSPSERAWLPVISKLTSDESTVWKLQSNRVAFT
jgi:hypothetical protein